MTTPSIMNWQINGDQVAVTFSAGIDQAKVLPLMNNFRPLLDWQKRIDKNLLVKSVEIQSVDLFGPRIGFLKMKCIAMDRKSQKGVPGIVFLRGDAVAILPIIHCDKDTYIMLTEQMRVPIGRKLLEIPAGMCDGDGNFSGVAIKELEEETGIHFNSKDLIDLGNFIPSPGACDEALHLFGFEKSITKAEMDEMKNKIYGEGDHETINLKFISEQEAWQLEDAKLLVALAKWKFATKK